MRKFVVGKYDWSIKYKPIITSTYMGWQQERIIQGQGVEAQRPGTESQV